jgi:cytochrome c
MRHGARTVAALALAAALAACGGGKQDEQPAASSEAAAPAAEATPAEATAANKPPAAFAQCMSCHSVEAGKNMIGPSLHGVVGRQAASLPGYAYSPALKGAGLTWNAATLDTWIAGPMKLVPGTKMTYAGMADPAKRKALIDWLATQK